MCLAKSKNILFTRSITDKHRQYASELNLHVTDKAFIQVNLTPLSDESIDVINWKPDSAWIFTSRNAVKVFSSALSQLENPENKKIFAVGEKTAEELSFWGLTSIVPEQHNSEGLLSLLEKEDNKSFFHFTGNLRQNVIADYMLENKKDFTEIICYETKLSQPEVNVADYSAVCFCSPSAVVSFFSKYHIDESVPCFAIGATTAVKLLDYTELIVMAEKTNLYSLLEICHHYLNS